MAEETLALKFEIFKGDKLVDTRTYRTPSVTIGSGTDAQLRLKHRSISELSCTVNVVDGVVQLVDLGAGNTSLRGEAVSNSVLVSGDTFHVGEIRVVISFDAATPGDTVETTAVKPSAEAAPAASTVDDEIAHDDDTDPGHHAAAAAAAAAQAAAPVTLVAPPVAQAAAAEPEAYDPDPEPEEDLPEEDIVAMIMRSGTAGSTVGVNMRRPMVLEVNQMWENTLLDTKHFAPGTPPVTIGSSVGWRWEFLGVDMGWVVPPLNVLLRYVPPMWSDVHADWRNDFYAPDAAVVTGNEHRLFTWDNDKFNADIDGDWDGFVDLEDKRYTFEELATAGKATKVGKGFAIPMVEGLRLMVDAHGVLFYSHMVRPGERVLSRLNDEIEYEFLAILSVVGFLGLMFGIVMWNLPAGMRNDVVEIPDRFVELLIDKPEVQQEKKKPSGNPDAGEGAKAKREEGKTGKKDATMKEAKGNKVEMQKRELDKQIADSAGVLGAMRDDGALDGVFGSSALNSDIAGGIGGLIGAKGTQIGSGGLGSRGSGLGGGGTAEGLGGLGTKGNGSGASGYGKGGGNFGAKGDGGIGQVGGDPIILGALDRSLIDEVVKQNMNKIRYCYQRELAKDNALGGKIVIRFTIAKDGSVSQAKTKTTTMNSSTVESCIEGRFMQMKFPEPKGGGIVIVSYPFLFAPG